MTSGTPSGSKRSFNPDRPEVFRRAVVLCCLLFLLLQVLYVSRLPLVMDEFQGARSVRELADRLPYRDFAPYKTVLGYYAQLPVLLAAQRPWRALLAVKLEMALAVSAVLALSALALGRRFDRRAVLWGLGLLLVMSTFAERSAELRVDALTALAGLGSLMLLLGRRPVAAGAICALSFLISQKGVYYLFASNAALGVVWLLVDRTRRRFVDIVGFNLAAVAVLVSYFGFWALVTSGEEVIRATFFSHGDIAFKQLYDNRLKYWSQTLRRNPLFYLLSILGLVRLAGAKLGGVPRPTQITLAVYGATIMGLAILHRQPWPYFFVLVIPTLWLLVVAFFHVESLEWASRPKRYRRLAIAMLVLLGLALPMARIPVVLARSNGYQRANVLLADALLGPDESYLAGTELIFDRRQVVRPLAWLDIPTSRGIADREVWEVEQLRRELAGSSVKLVVNNHRIYRLPRALRNHLSRTYEPWWGSIAIYSPSGDPGQGVLDIRFDGTYELVTATGAEVVIEGLAVAPGERVSLAAGERTFDSDRPFRLRYVPSGVEDYLDPDHRHSALMFPEVYTY